VKSHYEIKNIGEGIVKDVDFKSRTVTGYFSRFGNIDHDEDIIVPGAFQKSIKERGQEGKNLIPHLADHIMDTDHTLSKPKLYELPDGGFFESTITDTTKGIDILKQYRDGLITQHSFGFAVLRKEQKSDHREIKEAKIYEISSVVLGANEETPFTGFKSLTKPQLLDRYELMTKCFRSGDYSDEYFQILEAQIKQIEQDLLELFIKDFNSKQQHDTQATAPTVTTVTQPEVEVFNAERLNNIFKRLKVTEDNGRPIKKDGASC
jgi:HK97 family phage prohead protease